MIFYCALSAAVLALPAPILLQKFAARALEAKAPALAAADGAPAYNNVDTAAILSKPIDHPLSDPNVPIANGFFDSPFNNAEASVVIPVPNPLRTPILYGKQASNPSLHLTKSEGNPFVSISNADLKSRAAKHTVDKSALHPMGPRARYISHNTAGRQFVPQDASWPFSTYRPNSPDPDPLRNPSEFRNQGSPSFQRQSISDRGAVAPSSHFDAPRGRFLAQLSSVLDLQWQLSMGSQKSPKMDPNHDPFIILDRHRLSTDAPLQQFLQDRELSGKKSPI